MARLLQSLVILVCLIAITACALETKTQKGGTYGAAGGAVAGAVIGQIVGRDTEATLIGAAIGAAVGGAGGAAIGNMMDKQEAEMRQALADSEAAAIRREGNLLAVSLRGDVTFDTDSAIVKSGLYSEIDRIANILVKYPQTVIQVEGHTDSTGSETYNMDLSARRAEAVKNLLVQRGVDPIRILTVAFGESAPIASNATDYGRAQNRRVEIKVAPNA
ncbi:MAG: OmpA family protein [Desulfobulbales bacterium]|nr:OmpA family protein [Desulfobulbales bacterium]